MEKMDTTKHIYCVPGDRLCVSDDHSLSGAGTYTYRNYIHSALCGVVQVEQSRPDAECGSDGAQRAARTVTVVHDLRNRQEKLPTVGAVVTCRVVSIGSLQARCQISCVGQQLLRLPFRALLRKEDVRAEDKDRVEMHLCYRPRDIILAKVMGSSDQGYLLSTAEDELGVVVAYNEHNCPMVPVSWTEVVCPETYVKERRKVAKLVAEPAAAEPESAQPKK